jgi:hypothetical protein
MADEAAEKIAFARLRREAAGVSAGDWLFSDEEVREEIHERGMRALVEAAGWDLAKWEALAEYSKERSDVLLSGAEQLGIETGWGGWS